MVGDRWMSFTENGFRLSDIEDACGREVHRETIYGDVLCYVLGGDYVMVILKREDDEGMYFYRYEDDRMREVNLEDRGLRDRLENCKVYTRLLR